MSESRTLDAEIRTDVCTNLLIRYLFFWVLIRKIQAKLRFFVGSEDLHRDDLSFVLLAEEGIHDFQQQGFRAAGSFGDFRVDLHLAVQVNSVVQNVICAMKMRV